MVWCVAVTTHRKRYFSTETLISALPPQHLTLHHTPHNAMAHRLKQLKFEDLEADPFSPTGSVHAQLEFTLTSQEPLKTPRARNRKLRSPTANAASPRAKTSTATTGLCVVWSCLKLVGWTHTHLMHDRGPSCMWCGERVYVSLRWHTALRRVLCSTHTIHTTPHHATTSIQSKHMTHRQRQRRGEHWQRSTARILWMGRPLTQPNAAQTHSDTGAREAQGARSKRVRVQQRNRQVMCSRV